MKFDITKEQMLIGLQRVQNVVERRSTMPILSNALIKTEADGISIAATDLEVGIQSLLPAKIGETGAITIKARSLLEIVRELPNLTINFQSKDNSRLEIKAKKSVFNILGLPADDFPEVPGFSTVKDEDFVRINGSAIANMLDKTLYAVSTDEARYHLNGVFFESIQLDGDTCLRMVATDAHRLSIVDNEDAFLDDRAKDLFKDGVIVPRKGLQELKRLLSEQKEDFFIAVKDKMLLAKRKDIFLSMRLIEGKYADYKRIVPDTKKEGIKLDRQALLSSLKRVSLVSSDKSKSIALELEDGRLELSSQSPELGNAKEELGIDYMGDPLKLGFNSRYLIDALSCTEGDAVTLELRGKQNPGVIRSKEGRHTSVVMPMRI